ncbi:MAG: nuclear transport factor 2 family protein [Solirubrobacteraceae bacterium]
MRPDEIVDRYLEAVTARSLAELEAITHPEYTFREWPNAINPRGGERDLAGSRAGLEHARTLLTEHSFDVHEHLVHGDTVVSRMTWRGTLAATGQELVAHISQHNTVKDGRILRTESFDCYEPFG